MVNGPGAPALATESNLIVFDGFLLVLRAVTHATGSLAQLLQLKGADNPSLGHLIWHQAADRNGR